MKIERHWVKAKTLNNFQVKTIKTKGWAAEPAGERPYGLRPYEIKEAQALASALIAPLVTDSLRDLRQHIYERRRESGAAFQDGHRTPAEFARGVRWAETETIERYRRHDQLRWFIDRPVDDNALRAKESRRLGIQYSRRNGQPNRGLCRFRVSGDS